MDKVEFVIISETEHAIIDHGNGEFTSMPKAVYDTLASELVDSALLEKPKK